jgi:hypothetical protein
MLAFPGAARAAEGAAPAASTPPPGVDRVILRSGTVVDGRVTDQKEGDFVVIHASDGTTRTIAWSNVEQVVLAAGGSGDDDDTKTTFGRHSLAVEGTFKNAEAKRQAWLKAGGALASYDIRLNATGILLPKQSYPSPIVPGTPCETSNGQFASQPAPTSNGTPGSSGGGGGGLGGRIGLLYFKPPSPEAAFSGWWGFHAVSGLDFSAMGISLFEGFTATPGPPQCATGEKLLRTTTGFYSLAVPLDLGFNLGLGGFGDASSWTGLVLGLSYAPSYQVSGGFSGGSPSGNFNAAGFEVNFDYTSLRATMERYAQRAHFRFTAFLLPPVGNIPLVGTLGFGAVWY